MFVKDATAKGFSFCSLKIIRRSFRRPAGSVVADGNVPLERREALHQHQSEVILKLPTNERVEDGADAKVEVGEVTGDVNGVAPPLVLFTAGGAVLQQQHQVEGGPAHEKQQHDDKYEPDRLELAGYLGRQDGDGDPNVAVDDDDEREEQEEENLHVKSSVPQLSRVDVRQLKGVIVAVGLVVNIVYIGGVEKHLVYARQAADQPHHHAGDHRVPPAPHPRRVQGVHDREVSVEGQKSEEEDGAVEAQVVDAAVYLAHGFAEGPFGKLQVDAQEGEAGHEDEAGEHQVEQQDVGHGGQLLEPGGRRWRQLNGDQTPDVECFNKSIYFGGFLCPSRNVEDPFTKLDSFTAEPVGDTAPVAPRYQVFHLSSVHANR